MNIWVKKWEPTSDEGSSGEPNILSDNGSEDEFIPSESELGLSCSSGKFIFSTLFISFKHQNEVFKLYFE